MEIVLATYPWAYFTPGGGEIQIEMLNKYLKGKVLLYINSTHGVLKKSQIFITFFHAWVDQSISVII